MSFSKAEAKGESVSGSISENEITLTPASESTVTLSWREGGITGAIVRVALIEAEIALNHAGIFILFDREHAPTSQCSIGLGSGGWDDDKMNAVGRVLCTQIGRRVNATVRHRGAR